MQKIYISGPMTGYPDFNRPMFKEAEKWCRKNNYSPFNPGWLLFGEEDTFTYDEIMEIDLCALSKCEVILMLPGYEKSNGACIELSLAKELGLSIIYYEDYVRKEIVV